MGSNTIGKLFTFTTFGESHGEALGCIVEGFPPNFELDLEKLQKEMDRRRPGSTNLGTNRNEGDKIESLSGLYEGKTTGAPIMMLVRNTNQRSKDYSAIKSVFRPGHADYTFTSKYGIRDPRGGGRSSARETLARVAAGALAKQYLEKEGIYISAAVVSVGSVSATDYEWNPPFKAPLYAPDCKEYPMMVEEIEEARRNGDSVGALIECHIDGVEAGLGDPVFDKLDALLARAMFSIGAVKGFEIGSGFDASKSKGSVNNDQMRSENGKAVFLSNNAGGILGGISNGMPITMKIAFKPTPSIPKEQKTINEDMDAIDLVVEGRHDPCVGPRAVAVVEAMAAVVIMDSLLIQRAYGEQ